MRPPQDIERIPSIVALSNDRSIGELAFTFPEVLEVIRLCTENEIAVLGVELFFVKNHEYYASGCSTYHIQMMQKWPEVQKHNWSKYVQESNKQAEESVQTNPTGDEHAYVLSTSSWSEFCEIQKVRRAGGP